MDIRLLPIVAWLYLLNYLCIGSLPVVGGQGQRAPSLAVVHKLSLWNCIPLLRAYRRRSRQHWDSKVLNSETGDSLMEKTKMTDANYAVTVSLFSVAYAIFEVPSNWIMKRYIHPSRWLARLLFAWGMFTIGCAGVQNFTQVTVLRFFIGVFEAGFLVADGKAM